VEKRQPVHLQHVVSGYWHAVIMLGYNPSTGEVLVKDSLGSNHLKATWRSKQWFMSKSYGAVGVDLLGQPQNPPTNPFDESQVSIRYTTSPSTTNLDWTVVSFTVEALAQELSQIASVQYLIGNSSIDRTVTNADSHFRFDIRTTAAEVSLTARLKLHDGRTFEKRGAIQVEAAAEPEIAASDFQVRVEYSAGTSNGYKGFQFHLEAAERLLSQVEKVVYSIHPSFGANRIYSATSAAEKFKTIEYSTYARDWTTEGTVVHLRDGRRFDLAGTRIRW